MTPPPAIKSQPQYQPLAFDSTGNFHVFAGHAEGVRRVRKFISTLSTPSTQVHLVHPGATIQETLAALKIVLEASHMGLRLYLAGPEDFLWQAARLAREFGLSTDEMKLEHCGTLARPVYCVHCDHVTPDVRTNLVTCPGCGRTLFVRDHFSRHLSAYMGFQIDAETPGIVPAVEEVYP